MITRQLCCLFGDLEQPNYVNGTAPPQLAILPAQETRVLGHSDQPQLAMQVPQLAMLPAQETQVGDSDQPQLAMQVPQLAMLPAQETRVGDSDQESGGLVVNTGGLVVDTGVW